MNDPQQARIRYAMLKKPNQVIMTNMIKEAFNIRLYHPLGSLIRDDLGNSTQRIVGISPRPKSVRALPKLGLPNRLQNQA
jgi:hypothetical protein